MAKEKQTQDAEDPEAAALAMRKKERALFDAHMANQEKQLEANRAVVEKGAEFAAQDPDTKAQQTAERELALRAEREEKNLQVVEENKARVMDLENKAKRMTMGATGDDSLEDVQFASASARQAAVDAGMTADHFKRKRRSSEKGFTKADVTRLSGGAEE